ncbi:MAG: transporter suffix domain-containing protein [Bacteroidia bacterium]
MKKGQLIGFALIILSWIFWGLVFIVPFLKLGIKTTTLVVTVLLIATNIFWLGVFLSGKEVLAKFQIMQKIKIFLSGKNLK